MMKKNNDEKKMELPIWELDENYLVKDFIFEEIFRKEEEEAIRNHVRELIMPKDRNYSYEDILKLGGVMFHDESVLNIAWKNVDSFEHDDECIYYIALWIYNNFKHLGALSSFRSAKELAQILSSAIQTSYK